MSNGVIKRWAVIILFLSYLPARGQQDFSAASWRYMDSMLARSKNLSDLSTALNSMEQKARLEQRYLQLARCQYYQLKIQDRKSEDSFYFKNSAWIEEGLQQPQSPLYAYALHILMAKRLKGFVAQRYYQNRKSYERSDIPVNYAAYSKEQLDSIIAIHLEESKTLARQLRNQEPDDALWLSSDPYQFLFKPGLFDIAIAEQVSFLSNYRSGVYHSDAADGISSWLALSPDNFIAAVDAAAGINARYFPELKLFSEWLHYHKNEPATYYFLESVIRKFVFQQASRLDKDRAAYEKYLSGISRSPYSTVRANGVYQLCLLWNKKGENYFPRSMRSWEYEQQAYATLRHNDFDTTWQYYPVKALQLFADNKQMFDSFGYLKSILLSMEERILQSSMQLTLDNKVLPGEPILAQLKFKNAGTFYYRIVSLGTGFFYTGNEDKKKITALLQQPAVVDSAIGLHTPPDHNQHLAYINIGKLPAGHYAIIFSAEPVMGSTAEKYYCQFDATNIAVLNNDRRVYILHRKSGLPLTGAVARVHYAEKIIAGGTTSFSDHYQQLTVNSHGYVLVPDKKYNDITVYYGSDTAKGDQLNFNEPESPDDVYSKEEYDDLAEFYEENARAAIYTDRAIYRPGQTVYYKAVFITKNRRTGEQMVMSPQNLKGKLWENVYKKWQQGSHPVLNIIDPFQKIKDSLKIKLNEFGSVSGSFKIPKSAATGDWKIKPDYIDANWNYGDFRVEEYKRPAYEITIEKPKKEIRPGDEFFFRVKVRSFAGAALSHVQINYSVTRSGDLQEYDSLQKKIKRDYSSDDIIDTTGYTNEKGELEIPVNDSLLAKYQFENNSVWQYTYSLNAEAVDETGESYEANERINVSTQPVRIRIPAKATYERSNLAALPVVASDENAGTVGKELQIKVYRVTAKQWPFSSGNLMKADIWLYDKQALQQQFPFSNILQEPDREDSVLLFEKKINTAANEKLDLDSSIFTAGKYAIVAQCLEGERITGMAAKNFSVTDYKNRQLPEATESFHYLPFNAVMPGNKLELYYGNTWHPAFSIFNIACDAGSHRRPTKLYYEERKDEPGLQQYQFSVPAAATGNISVAHIMVFNNQVFTYTQNISVMEPPASEPEIIIEQYRKVLAPGAKETFVISVKTKNENTAAELMTTMYDASLDKLERLRWAMPRKERPGSYDMGWERNISFRVSSSYDFDDISLYRGNNFSPDKPLWWAGAASSVSMPTLGRTLDEMEARRNGGFDFDMNLSDGLAGKVAGLYVANTEGLNEVVVTGYGATKLSAKALSASVITIRGAASLIDYKQPLIILDGVPYTGDVSKLNISTITAGLVLKGADAVALYGAQAAQGVLILSTRGEIIFPELPGPEPVARKNFSELAFFFPAIHADKEGYYTMSFTMPESVTEWNWKMLAHTKNAVFVSAERKLNTQLPLMVQPAMPRLLYQGDHILLQSRITNLDTSGNAGVIRCKIEDVVTGDDITSKLLSTVQKDFSVEKKSNTTSGFDIRVPDDQLNPLRIIVTVRTGSFADGEEHIIPVLSPRVFVRQSQPYYLSAGAADTVLQLPSLPADAAIYGIGLSLQPRPAAALINSLPYLVNYPYGCAEQTFNKLLAHAAAVQLIRNDTALQRSFEAAKAGAENKTPAESLPDELAEETMPWLNLSNNTAAAQQKLFNLLDVPRSEATMDELLRKLFKMQTGSGGLAWFSGGEANFYISCYVLRGFGFMSGMDMKIKNAGLKAEYTEFIKRLIRYADQQAAVLLLKEEKNSMLYYVYARSYWLNDYLAAEPLLQTIRQYILHETDSGKDYSLYRQALLAVNGFRYAAGNDSAAMIARAADLLNSLQQQAIADPQNGVRWKELADPDDLTNSAEEVIALLAEAFTAGKMDTMNSGIVKWLLGAKTEHSWNSTKATAAALNVLLKEPESPGSGQRVNMTVNEKTVSCSNDLLRGNIFEMSRVDKQPQQVQLHKEEAGSAQGAVIRYYFSKAVPAFMQTGDITLKKEFRVWNTKTNEWGLLHTGDTLHIADKVLVTLTVESRRQLSYVLINDKRAALFEPADNNSGYRYESGLGYYRSVRDEGCQFFADNISSGLHTISYEMKVTQQGTFFSGPAVLQCMYKPAVAAYSNTGIFNAMK